MRLKQTRVRTFNMCPRTVTKDNEGVTQFTYIAENGYTVRGEFWDGVGERHINEYGDTIDNTASMRVEGEYRIELENGIPKVVFGDGRELRITDGVYVYADTQDEPDYIVKRILGYHPLKLEVEHYA